MSKKIRAKLGWWLRCWADRIDYEHSFRSSGFRLRFKEGIGATFSDSGPGLRLWYQSHEYDNAHR